MIAISMAGMIAPDLKWRRRNDGRLVAYWVCPGWAVKKFKVKCQRLWTGHSPTQDDLESIARQCRRLRDQVSNTQAGRRRPTAHFSREGSVYFLRCGALIKIGFSITMKKRISNLRQAAAQGIDVMGSMPGTADDERMIHHRFQHLREKGEWFREAPELLSFIEQGRRSQFGVVL